MIEGQFHIGWAGRIDLNQHLDPEKNISLTERAKRVEDELERSGTRSLDRTGQLSPLLDALKVAARTGDEDYFSVKMDHLYDWCDENGVRVGG